MLKLVINKENYNSELNKRWKYYYNLFFLSV